MVNCKLNRHKYYHKIHFIICACTVLLLLHCTPQKKQSETMTTNTEKTDTSTTKSKIKTGKTKINNTDSLLNKLDSINAFRLHIYTQKKRLNKTFSVDRFECFWSFDPQKSNKILLFGVLENSDRVWRLMILDGEESFEDFEKKWFNDQIDAVFKDVNFNKNKDFIIYSREKSGNGGRFYDVYTFYNKERRFYYSEELSGGNFQLDKKSKTASTFWKFGINENITQTFRFRGDGMIHYTEVLNNKVFKKDTIDYLVTTYKKYKYKQLLETKIDTTEFDGW